MVELDRYTFSALRGGDGMLLRGFAESLRPILVAPASPEAIATSVARLEHELSLKGEPVIQPAEIVARAIVEAYLGPNRSIAELRTMINSDLDPLKGFSEACREELRSQGYL